MKTLIINPNTHEGMTQKMKKATENINMKDNQLNYLTNKKGPASVEGYFDGVVSSEGVLSIIAENKEDYDVFIVACYSDHPSIYAAREITDKPVLGIAESSMLLACMVSEKFSIVTTSKKWEPLLRKAVESYGLKNRCASVRSTELSVLEYEEKSTQEVQEILLEKSRLAVKKDGAESIILGCAGMTSEYKFLNKNIEVPVIEGVRAAINFGEVLVNLGIKTSKLGTFASVIPRDTQNLNQELTSVYKK